MALNTIPYDIANYLDSEAAIQEYFSQVLEDGDSAEIVRALGHIARARGMADLAEKSGLGRESLYKALSANAKPRFDTILKVTRALGLPLTVASTPHG
ncbi:MAG: putative addiction module antidote protein [Pseudomonadales bacterium]|jgi:probable addiction module antidote protein|nr:putative addiction module antidote protein [Pseudomonadales bacterium]